MAGLPEGMAQILLVTDSLRGGVCPGGHSSHSWTTPGLSVQCFTLRVHVPNYGILWALKYFLYKDFWV